MLQKLFFLFSITGVPHAGWYTYGNGYTMGLVIAAIVALVTCVLFYYVWGKIRSLTMGHYIVMIIISVVLTFISVFFTARELIGKFASEYSLDQHNPSVFSEIKSGTVDMWLFSANAAIWCIVFYFLFSCVLKNWSTYYNIPFGNRKRAKVTKIQK